MKYIQELVTRYPVLDVCANDIQKVAQEWITCFENGGKLLIAGNGGSAADADHIVGELMKGFVKKRKIDETLASNIRLHGGEYAERMIECMQGALPAINLSTHQALHSAFANDVDYGIIFAQMLAGYARLNDLFLGISTSGNSANILKAGIVAKSLGVKTIGLTGATGGKMDQLFDMMIRVPEIDTFKIQELHLPVYHALCLTIEEHFFKD